MDQEQHRCVARIEVFVPPPGEAVAAHLEGAGLGAPGVEVHGPILTPAARRRHRAHFGKEICIRGNCDQAPFSLASMMRERPTG